MLSSISNPAENYSADITYARNWEMPNKFLLPLPNDQINNHVSLCSIRLGKKSLFLNSVLL